MSYQDVLKHTNTVDSTYSLSFQNSEGQKKTDKIPPIKPEHAIDILNAFEIGVGYSNNSWDNDDPNNLNGQDLDSTETSLFLGYDYQLFKSKVGISQVKFDDALTFPGTIFFAEAEMNSFSFIKYEFSDPTSILWNITEPHNNRIGSITAAFYGKLGIYSGWSNKDDIDRVAGNIRFFGKEEEKVSPSIMLEGGLNFRLVLGKLGRLNMKVFTHHRVVKGSNKFEGSVTDATTGNPIASPPKVDPSANFEEIGGGVSFEYTRYLTDMGLDKTIFHIEGGNISGTKSFILIGLKFLL